MVRSMGRVVVGLIAVLLLCERPALAKHADIVLYNGRVFTSNESALWAEALAIRGDSVVAVGRSEDVLKQADKSTRLVDLAGRLVVPGFNDAQVHTTPYGLVINSADFPPGPGPTIDQMLAAITKAVGEYPAGTWLTGIMGEAMLGDPSLDRYLLDTVSPNHPVLLMYWWMLAVINPVNLGEGLTLEEAVIAHTRGSAYAEFEEYRKGTLAPGMLADLVVLSDDIFQMPIEALPATRSVLTMVGGKVVYATGELTVP